MSLLPVDDLVPDCPAMGHVGEELASRSTGSRRADRGQRSQRLDSRGDEKVDPLRHLVGVIDERWNAPVSV